MVKSHGKYCLEYVNLFHKFNTKEYLYFGREVKLNADIKKNI